MKWLNAQYAAILMPLWATASRAFAARGKATPCFGAAPRPDALPPLKSDGLPQMAALSEETLIHRRAMRQGNRKPEAVAAFVRIHTILGRGK